MCRTSHQNDMNQVGAMITSSSTETSSLDNSASTDDHLSANPNRCKINDTLAPNEDDSLPTCCAMQSLRNKIALEKAKLMRNVEVNSNKCILDEGIDCLHALQRQYFALEKQIEYGNHNGDQVCVCHELPVGSSCVDQSVADRVTTSRSNCNSHSYTVHLQCIIV